MKRWQDVNVHGRNMLPIQDAFALFKKGWLVLERVAGRGGGGGWGGPPLFQCDSVH